MLNRHSAACIFALASMAAILGSATCGTSGGETSGQVVHRALHTPCGVELSSASNASERDPDYRFTGYERDDALSMLDAGARFYSPTLCRMTGVDPVDSAGTSPYAYANNNPLKFVDPDGRWPFYWDLASKVASWLNSAQATFRELFNRPLSASERVELDYALQRQTALQMKQDVIAEAGLARFMEAEAINLVSRNQGGVTFIGWPGLNEQFGVLAGSGVIRGERQTTHLILEHGGVLPLFNGLFISTKDTSFTVANAPNSFQEALDAGSVALLAPDDTITVVDISLPSKQLGPVIVHDFGGHIFFIRKHGDRKDIAIRNYLGTGPNAARAFLKGQRHEDEQYSMGVEESFTDKWYQRALRVRGRNE